MKVNFESIYDHIGYLFFSIAYNNQPLSVVEVIKLTDLVEEGWRGTPTGDPQLNSHLVDCIHAGIKNAMEERMSHDTAWDNFLNYYGLHTLPFSVQLKEKILLTSALIAKTFPSSARDAQVQEIGHHFGIKVPTV